MTDLTLKKLANALDMRPRRVHEKVHKLGLHLESNNSEPSISVPDAIHLLRTYIGTDKTNSQTKDRANSLLQELSGSDFTPKKIKTIQSSSIGKRQSVNINNPRKPISNFVHNLVQVPISFLESVHFKFMALIVAVIVQMHHSAEWYHRTVPNGQNSWYTAYGYAFMVDLFILAVTMEGKVNVAKTFATLTFLSNVLYFQCWVGFDLSVNSFARTISSLLISAIMAYIVYAYTELFVKYRKPD